MQEALAANPAIAAMLVELFHARLDPGRQPEAPDAKHAAMEQVDAELAVMVRIEAALDEVANLDEDRILRSYIGVIRATLRTNYYQRGADDAPKPYLSFKLDPKRIPELPEPRPMYEIFVYSPRVEGVHLRGGAVARGGIRWSDRREDFRTEVLGLAKAQQVKNAVIVPVGSKGGFVPKRLPAGAGREAIQEEGIACYRIFIRGLLDVTDNLAGGEVAPPPRVVRHDGDDPYLVVAADKGTATFSDAANALAAEYGFWLGDAFASGGSQGYDHKGMGITARGGWESVKRHFRELGVDWPEHRLHGGRDRRHGRRRVRERDAAVAPHPAGGRVQPHARLHRSGPGPGRDVRRARAPVRPPALDLGRLRPLGAVRRRRHPSPQRQVHPPEPRGPRRARHRGCVAHPQRADRGDAEGAGRPDLERRDRHLREVPARVARRRPAIGPTTWCG